MREIDCEAVGTDTILEQSKERGLRNKRFTHGSLRTKCASKLALAYTRDPGVAPAWRDQPGVGNPVRSDIVNQCMAFTRSEQTRAGVRVYEAPTLLHSHVAAIIAPMTARLEGMSDPVEKVVMSRNISILAVAFCTTKRVY